MDKCKDIVNLLKVLKSEVLKMESEVCSRDSEHWSNLIEITTKIDSIIYYINLSRSK